MTLDERIAEAEKEMAEAWDDCTHAVRDMRAIRRARYLPALQRHADWQAEHDRLLALKSGDSRSEGER